MREDEFMECAVCKAKTGSPLLCASCLHNRRAIERLSAILDDVGTVLERFPAEEG